MRLSPARILELSARTLAIAGILWLLVASLRPVVAMRTARVGISALPTAAAAWARNPAIARAHLTMDSTPSMAALSAGRALRGAGVAVSWSGDVPSLAIVAAPAPDPSRSVRLTVAATTGNIVLEDDAGTLDTLSPQGGRGGAMLVAPSVHGTVRARAAGSPIAAAAVVRDSLLLRPTLVLGRAGWESKFVVAALEESGWQVATRLGVAPKVVVRQATGDADAPIDTARYSAVVVLDSSVDARTSGAITRFVRAGGGLVLAGTAPLRAELTALAPATPGARVAARPALVADSIDPRTLGRYSLSTRDPHAVVLSRYGGEIALVAKRVGLGRVVQTGADETWRWRMEGREGSDVAHRAWWSRLVASVVYAPVVERRASPLILGAPRAQIMDVLGPSRALAEPPSAWNPLRHRTILVAVLLLLLVEWTSRRIRGAR